MARLSLLLVLMGAVAAGAEKFLCYTGQRELCPIHTFLILTLDIVM
jgi:hypothetical protein